MSDTKILLYLGLFVGVTLLLIFRPTRPDQPSRLKMREKKKDPSKSTQISGARWVAAESMDEKESATSEVIAEAEWVNPTITFKGQVLDAYAVLGLVPGASLEQIKSHAQMLLSQASHEREKQKIKSAVSAIEKSFN